MSTGERVHGHPTVSLDDGRNELDRLLEDARFHGTERSRAILLYLAERRFQGCTEAVKAYTVALDVLGRGSGFDASNDPIVRIEMSRLRSALSQYYEAFGDKCGISISIPVGRYLAVFSRNGSPGAAGNDFEAAAGDVVDEPVDGSLASEGSTETFAGSGKSKLYVVGIVALVLTGTGSVATAWYNSRDLDTERPSVTLAITSPQDENGAEAAATADYLVTALSRFRTLDITAQKNMATGSTSSQPIPSAGSLYDIEMKYYADGDDRTVWWQVIDGHGGTILKSGVDKVEADGRNDTAVRDELVSILAKRFGSTRGVINVLESHHDWPSTTIGNACVLNAEYSLDEGGREGIQKVLPCLERTVLAQPTNSDALAVLSRVLVAAEGGNPATTPYERALTLANRAASLDPTSARAQVAIMMAQFYIGRTEAAIAAGNQAMALNPDSPDVLSKLAAVLYSSGYDEAGVSLARDAGKGVDTMPRDARIVLALDAYARGDYSNASLVSEQINCGDIVVRAIRAASLGKMGSPGAKASLAYLSDALPDYRTSLGKWMGWRRYPASVIASLEQGLAKAAQVNGAQASAAN